MYTGQGWPAFKSIETSTPKPALASKDWFFWSQRRHRCAWRDGLGCHVGTPTQFKKSGAKYAIYADRPGRYRKLTGAAIWLGTVR